MHLEAPAGLSNKMAENILVLIETKRNFKSVLSTGKSSVTVKDDNAGPKL
jgi:hypothetical protein